MPSFQGFLDIIQNAYLTFNAYSQKNPVIAGVVGMWGLTVVSLLLRNVPLRIYSFFKRQFTTTLTFTNQNTGSMSETFSNFLRWYQKNTWSRWSRQISIDGATNHADSDCVVTNEERVLSGTTVGPGPGNHFFMYKRWPFWMSRRILESGSTSAYQINYEITITTLGRNRDRILDLISEFRHRSTDTSTMVKFWNGGHWDRLTEVGRRKIETVILDDQLKNELIGRIDQFISSEDWYISRGLPYKLIVMLHGPPGGGKSSLIKAIAATYGRGISQLSLNTVDDTSIYRAISNVDRSTIIAVEDIDSSTATRARAPLRHARTAPDEPTELESVSDALSRINPLTLAGLLNALDGIASLHGQIIFLSTNVPEQLDPALLRKGRVDLMVYVGELQQKEIHKYITLMFPDADIPDGIRFKPIMGCDLQDIYLQHRDNLDAFIQAIPKMDGQTDLRLVHN